MSLLPFLLDNPFNFSKFAYHPKEVYLFQLSRPSGKSSSSTDVAEEDHFKCNMDVRQFNADDITVKLIGDNMISVEGKQEEKQDEHGFVSRHFLRKFKIPEGYDIENAKSKLSTDGVLSIVVPKVMETQEDCREIPIIETGKPNKVITDEEKTHEDVNH